MIRSQDAVGLGIVQLICGGRISTSKNAQWLLWTGTGAGNRRIKDSSLGPLSGVVGERQSNRPSGSLGLGKDHFGNVQRGIRP